MNWWAIIGVAVLVVGFAVMGSADIVNRECNRGEEDR